MARVILQDQPIVSSSTTIPLPPDSVSSFNSSFNIEICPTKVLNLIPDKASVNIEAKLLLQESWVSGECVEVHHQWVPGIRKKSHGLTDMTDIWNQSFYWSFGCLIDWLIDLQHCGVDSSAIELHYYSALHVVISVAVKHLILVAAKHPQTEPYLCPQGSQLVVIGLQWALLTWHIEFVTLNQVKPIDSHYSYNLKL